MEQTLHEKDDPTSTRVVNALRVARQRIEQLDKARREPIAIIGMSCRFPAGANDLDAFWSRLRDGVDCVGAVPERRWNAEQFAVPGGKTELIEHGAFLDDVEGFDAEYFGISPREARQLDPQQRILLEGAGDAFRNAGLNAQRLAGSQTGVFVGVVNNDYLQLQLGDPRLIDIYSIIGGVHCMLANRISYLFDLRGPSMAIDTACSGSLAAVHLACQSLRAAESDIALAAGVNLVLSPFTTLGYVRAFPLSADGRCKTFDSRADGYVRGEGCGTVVLKRLSDAQADGDMIWAVIRGSALNQDGRTNGLTAPSGLAQQRVIQQALANGGVAPEQVTYVEAHGTGTQLGDPIEVEALRMVYSRREGTRNRCALGSVKANVGHLEAASGIAGLIKMALCLHHAELPKQLHFHCPNPELPLAGSRFFIPTELQAWDVGGEQRVGAVSAFGAGGTNVHVIVEEAPRVHPAPGPDEVDAAPGRDDSALVLTLSAHLRTALSAMARSWSTLLETTSASAVEVCATAALRQTLHSHRLAVVADTKAELAEALITYATGGRSKNVFEGTAERTPRIAFVFSGMGGQWPGMAGQLIAKEPVFREAIERCMSALEAHVDWAPAVELKRAGAGQQRGGDVPQIVQPLLWCVQVALAQLWMSLGIQPDAMIGHSMGELAMAVVSGALSHEDAAKVICTRSRLISEITGGGAMLLVAASEAMLSERLAGLSGSVSVAASNSPMSTVLCGDVAALDTLEGQLREDNVFARRVNVNAACHGPMVEPLMSRLRHDLGSLTPREARVPLMSTVTAAAIQGMQFDAEYWVKHIRGTVRFCDAVKCLLDKGYDTFIEIGPHPILTTSIEEIAEQAGRAAQVLGTMWRDGDSRREVRSGLAALHVAGAKVDWSGVFASFHRPVRLPNYPWQHQRYWFRPDVNYWAAARQDSTELSTVGGSDGQPGLAGARDTSMFSNRLQVARPDERSSMLHTHVLQAVARALGRPWDGLDPDTGFFQMGMDSIMAVQLRKQLTSETGIAIKPTALFEHATVTKLAKYLSEVMTLPSNEERGSSSRAEDTLSQGEQTDSSDALTDHELLDALAQELGVPCEIVRADRSSRDVPSSGSDTSPLGQLGV